MLLIGIFCLVRYYGSCGSAVMKGFSVRSGFGKSPFCSGVFVCSKSAWLRVLTHEKIFQDKEGAWVVGFLRWLGVCYVFEAEL
ncbi:hypothetical protein V6N11_014270 [Hibiscus sabdariffa]|uniref:Secreted protein n=1 Tax=Hibiscus sabdariffa TaxID=183260 RepID=A0ABR1ZBM8_9ROSI